MVIFKFGARIMIEEVYGPAILADGAGNRQIELRRGLRGCDCRKQQKAEKKFMQFFLKAEAH
jgi:hypothetical protein